MMIEVWWVAALVGMVPVFFSGVVIGLHYGRMSAFSAMLGDGDHERRMAELRQMQQDCRQLAAQMDSLRVKDGELSAQMGRLRETSKGRRT